MIRIDPARAKPRERVRHYLVLAVLLLACALARANPRAQTAPTVFDGTLGEQDASPELSTAAFKAALADPGTVVFDARPYAEFAVSHIPGARSVAAKPGTTPAKYVADVDDVTKRVRDKSTRIVVYCNGLHCGRSKRFATDLLQAGYKNVRRFQLGIPMWRALGGVTQVEKDLLLDLLARDKTAVLIDARERADATPALANAKSIPLREATAAKDDGRLPMTDHNTRIFVVGANGHQARQVAEGIVKAAFHNVSFFAGSVTDLPELAATVNASP